LRIICWFQVGKWNSLLGRRGIECHSLTARGTGLRGKFLILSKLHSAVDDILLPFFKRTSFRFKKVCSIPGVGIVLPRNFQPKTSRAMPHAPDLSSGCLWENTLQKRIGCNGFEVARINKLLIIICWFQVRKWNCLLGCREILGIKWKCDIANIKQELVRSPPAAHQHVNTSHLG